MARFLLKSALVPLLTVKLLETSKIHLVFHVSLLKQHQGPLPNIPDSLPPMSSDNHLVVEPLQVLEWKCDNACHPPNWFWYNGQDQLLKTPAGNIGTISGYPITLRTRFFSRKVVMIAIVPWPLIDQGGPPGCQHTSVIMHKGQLKKRTSIQNISTISLTNSLILLFAISVFLAGQGQLFYACNLHKYRF